MADRGAASSSLSEDEAESNAERERGGPDVEAEAGGFDGFSAFLLSLRSLCSFFSFFSFLLLPWFFFSFFLSFLLVRSFFVDLLPLLRLRFLRLAESDDDDEEEEEEDDDEEEELLLLDRLLERLCFFLSDFDRL